MKYRHYISYILAVIAIGVFGYCLTLPHDDQLREQAIYWFGFTVILFMIPDIQKFKAKDIELEFREEIKIVKEQVAVLSDTFFNSIGRVWQHESEIPVSLREQRNKHWDRCQSLIDALSDEEREHTQIENTRMYLLDYNITPSQLKEKLTTLGCYTGQLTDTLDKNLIGAIEKFQRTENLRHVDGIFGPLTYQRMTEVLSRRELR